MIDLLSIGLTTLDVGIHPLEAMPAVDENVLVPTIRFSPAGTAGGTAMVAATLGLTVAIASNVGADLQGQTIRDGLERANVDVSLLAIDRSKPSSTTVLTVREDGQRATVHMVGASSLGALPEKLIDRVATARSLHWGGIGCPGLKHQGLEILKKAKNAGVFVTCDLIIPHSGTMNELAPLLPYIDMFMPSVAEVRVLAQTDDMSRAADGFMALGAGACIIKMGRRGMAMFRPNGAIHVPAFDIDPVDTTTCGDSVCAGFHAARINGLGDEDSLRFAAAVAAKVAMGVGSLGALTGYDDTMTFSKRCAVVA